MQNNIPRSSNILSFQAMIMQLQQFWQEYGCLILQPYDNHVGAGTFHPATVMRALSEENWNIFYIQPSRRPVDSRYGKHPNRTQHYYQGQLILKPSPDNMQELFLQSLLSIGLDYRKHDIRFVEDNWESPTLGASGLGYEVWCNGMEVTQFTYMQQIGDIILKPVACEITYGLERLALYVQNIDKFADICWHNMRLPQLGIEKSFTYKELEFSAEEEFSFYNIGSDYKTAINIEKTEVEILKELFAFNLRQAQDLIDNKSLVLPAYDLCLNLNHLFNIIDARQAFTPTQRAVYIQNIRNIVNKCCKKWLEKNKA